ARRQAAFAEGLRQREGAGRARAVVVRAVPDRVVAPAGHAAAVALASHAHGVVVVAQDDALVLELGVRPLDEADDVLRVLPHRAELLEVAAVVARGLQARL